MAMDNSTDAPASFLAFLGRILLALIFVLGGINKLDGGVAATASNMASHGIPYSNILVWGVVALELGGGLMLMAGLLTRWISAALFFYTVALALIFHPYWTFPAAAARTQHAFFYEHVAMLGGFLYVIAYGAGAWSLDALTWRRRSAPVPAE